MRISAVWYPVSGWEEAKRFYGELLGLRQTQCDDQAGWAAYAAAGGPPLFLVRKPAASGAGAGAVVTFECQDLEALRARLMTAGTRVEGSLQEGAGVRILTFYDPDGNRLEASETKS